MVCESFAHSLNGCAINITALEKNTACFKGENFSWFFWRDDLRATIRQNIAFCVCFKFKIRLTARSATSDSTCHGVVPLAGRRRMFEVQRSTFDVRVYCCSECRFSCFQSTTYGNGCVSFLFFATGVEIIATNMFLAAKTREFIKCLRCGRGASLCAGLMHRRLQPEMP